jgi:hypothetical protein
MINNVLTENGDHVQLKVESVNSVSEHKNLNFADVKLQSGKDSTIQISKSKEDEKH